MEKNLGHATAYGYAKSKGYSGTEEEFAELMADYASVGQSAAQSAEQAAALAESASGSATTAAQAAQTATDKASEAVTAAGTATTKASEASQSATSASQSAESAGTSAQTATTAATTATTKASEASESAATATAAKTDAETARDAAAQSASEAAASAESIDPDEFDRKIYAAFATDTATGVIASLPDGADSIPMKDVLVHVDPVQDLHGYDSPWPAGGGKNLFNYDAWKTVNITGGTGVFENNGIKITATNNDAYTNYKVNNFPANARIPVSEGDVITLAWEESTNTAGSIYIFPNGAVSGAVFTSNANHKSLSYTAGAGITFITFRFGVSTSGNTISYKNIQVVKGTTVPAWTPYSNICPITGWTGAKVTRCGKNLLPNELVSGTQGGVTFTKNADGSVTLNGTATADFARAFYGSSSNDLKTFPYSDKPITLSGCPVGGGTSSYRLGGYLYKNGQYTGSAIIDVGDSKTVRDVDFDQIYVALFVYSGYTFNNLTFYPMIEYGTSPTAYEPYSGQTYDITFPTEAGTVYGGTLDVTTGELVVDRGFKVFNGSENWEFSSTSIRPNIKITDIAYKGAVICNMYPYSPESIAIEGTISTNGGIGYNIWIKDSINGDSLANWKTFLATNNLQVIYELATPITYQLTPQEITSLLGENNLWADTGNTEVEYRASTKMYIDKKITEAVSALS